jgi:pyruvate/2-oxoglutarate/acetoin dehydrogenase E1 component
MQYFEELCKAMAMLARQPNAIFLGQGVGCAGTSMTDTLRDVPQDKLLEFPVAEDLQMGTAIGMALEGMLPVCIFPRWNFMLCAANQIVNHLDRLPIYSKRQYEPKIIIRVSTPVTHPFDPGPQHDDDFTSAFRQMLRRVQIVMLTTPESVMHGYERALRETGSKIFVEYTELYGTVPSGVPEKAAT